jgi:hypothetical protein
MTDMLMHPDKNTVTITSRWRRLIGFRLGDMPGFKQN